MTQQYFSDDKFAEDGFLDGESGFSDGGGNQFGGSEQFLPVEYIEGELYDAMFGAHAVRFCVLQHLTVHKTGKCGKVVCV